tara:strand:- start:711 stop:890 length:180 start_codon:yes stop_codon:yes gene_type:complete
MSILPKQDNQVILCCNTKGGCPTIEKIEDNKITIKDDYGNSVIMSLEEAKLIPQALKQI